MRGVNNGAVGADWMGRATRGLALVLAPLLLAGCSDLLSGGPAPTTYDLSAQAAVSQPRRSGARLAVREPNAIQLLDSERIVFRPDGARVTYLADAQWPDRLPNMIEARLVASFAASGERTVSRASDALSVQFQLLTEVRDFSIAKTPEGTIAHVSIYAQLISDSSGAAITGKLFEAHVRAAGEEPPAGVAALDTALAGVLRDVVRWTLSRM